MKVLKSFTLILSIWMLGEIASFLIKDVLLIPGSILGMIFLFLLLQFKVIKLESVDEIATFLVAHFAFFIIPFGLAFVKYYDVIKDNAIVMVLCGVVATIVSMILTMKFVDFLVDICIKRRGKCND